MKKHSNGRAWLALALSTLLTGCQAPSASQECRMAHVADLPLTKRGKEFFVTILINDHSALMAIDTGSDVSVIRGTSANRLNMRDHGFETSTLVGIGGENLVHVFYADNVHLGITHGRGLPFFAPDKLDEPADVDGVLGMDFLNTLDLDLDLWGGHLGIYYAIEGCDQPSTAMAGPLYSVPLAPAPVDERSASPEIFATIAGKTLRAIVDTGAFNTTLFHAAATRVGLSEADSLGAFSVTGYGRRKVEGRMHAGTKLEIGDLTISNMPILVLDQSRLANIDMLLGFDFMTRVHLWISHSSNRLIMQYPPTATPP